MSVFLCIKRFSVALVICVTAIGLTSCQGANATSVRPGTSCDSLPKCQLLAELAFHKHILVPHDSKLVSGGYSKEGLGILFRLPTQDFDTIVNRSHLTCSKYEMAVTGRKFCYAAFENGCNAAFVADGLTYDIISTQDGVDKRVPRLPQAMTAVASYGKP